MKPYGWCGVFVFGKSLDVFKYFMEVSFCIVNLNAKNYLVKCIKSISKAIKECSHEIIIVDNNSKDGSSNFIKNNYPYIKLITNRYNYGYTKAINQAIKNSVGNYKVILNPDTMLYQNSITILLQFLKNNKKVGIVGPKVINVDGTFQGSCKRGLAKPLAVFSYFLKLSYLFPNEKKYSEYHLSHQDENKINEVSGVSGSCMVIRKCVIDKIGLFDERYFAYQEDSDFCLRTQKAGWKVYYNPQSVVMHVGGRGGSNAVPYRSIYEWHRSYYIYYFKFFSKSYSVVFNIFYVAIMFGKLIFATINHFLRS